METTINFTLTVSYVFYRGYPYRISVRNAKPISHRRSEEWGEGAVYRVRPKRAQNYRVRSAWQREAAAKRTYWVDDDPEARLEDCYAI